MSYQTYVYTVDNAAALADAIDILAEYNETTVGDPIGHYAGSGATLENIGYVRLDNAYYLVCSNSRRESTLAFLSGKGLGGARMFDEFAGTDVWRTIQMYTDKNRLKWTSVQPSPHMMRESADELREQ